jgi:uncharacterized protein (DUF4415 family)
MHTGKIPAAANPNASTTQAISPDRDASGHPWPAGVGPATRPRKVLLSLRVDHDVLAWFRARGPGYQTRMSAVLRAYMEHARGDRARG